MSDAGPSNAIPLSPVVIASRLLPPVLPHGLVQRTLYTACLQPGSSVGLVLYCAPAGFGKTTAMARHFEQLRNAGQAGIWVLLDDADNDVERFLFKVHAALDAAEAFPSVVTGDAGEMLLDLSARLALARGPFALFFDEFERLRNPVLQDLFRELLDSLPAQGRAVIGTREQLRLNLGRWRASGRVLEIGPADLRFTEQEAQALLAERSGVALSGRALQQLMDRTEGWVAALQLAALSLARHPDPDAFAMAFSGSNAAVADYLLETVLSGLPAEHREFLQSTCILNELDPALCNAVTGRDDSLQVLHALERANVLLVPLDDQRQRYRYHALLADFLRTQLAAGGPARSAQLHLRASHRFEAAGRPVPAIEHALSAGDAPRGLALIEPLAHAFLLGGRFRLLARWFDALPREVIQARPLLALAYAGALAMTRRSAVALRLLDDIEQLLASTPLEQARDLRSRMAALRGLALAMMDRPEECLELSQRWCRVDETPPDHPLALLDNALAFALIVATRFDEGMVVLSRAKQRHAAAGNVFNMAIAETIHGDLEVLQGRLPDALARLRGAMERLGSPSLGRAIGRRAALGVALASAFYQQDRVDEAARLLKECLPLVKEAGTPDTLIVNHLVLARCARAGGDTETALQRLAELELFGHMASLPRLAATAWLERSKWALADGAIDLARDYLQRAADFSGVWAQLKRFPANANDCDDLRLAMLRWEVRSGRHADVLLRLKQEIAEAEASRRRVRAALLRLFQVEALVQASQQRQAMRHLADLIEWLATGGYVRLLVDEGPVVARLLSDLQSQGLTQDESAGLQGAFIKQVLRGLGHAASDEAGAAATATQAAADAPLEPLSERELQVLRVLEKGYSNKDIGKMLFISENTVKVHLRNLHSKLAVHTRSQAVSVARRMGLLD